MSEPTNRPQWQPIGTEPVGEPILATDGREVVALVIADLSTHYTAAHGVLGYDCDCSLEYRDLTHWMPLPLPPKCDHSSHQPWLIASAGEDEPELKRQCPGCGATFYIEAFTGLIYGPPPKATELPPAGTRSTGGRDQKSPLS